MQSPFGRPLFDRLGLNAGNTAMPTPSRALPLPQGYDPNVNQPSIGDFDGRFAQAAAQAANRNPNPLAGFRRFFDGVNGLPSDPFADVVYQSTLGPGTSLTALNQMTRVPGPDPFNGRPVPLPNPGGGQLQGVTPGQPMPPSFRQPGDVARYVAFNDPGQPGAGFSNYEEYLAAGNSPAVGEIATTLLGSPNDLGITGPGMGPAVFANSALNPNRPTGIATNLGSTGNPVGPGPLFRLPPPLTDAPRPPGGAFSLDAIAGQPINSGGGLSNMAFPTLAPSRPNTFTGGLFGGNNPMNNNPMNGGGMNSNQPLSQQIPQVVQQAVTPLLQNTATQLNQGLGSMVNQSLVGGGGQTGSGGGGLPAFGGTPAPSNMSSLLLGGGFNPFR